MVKWYADDEYWAWDLSESSTGGNHEKDIGQKW